MTNDTHTALLTEFPIEEVRAALEEWWESEQADSTLPGDEPTPLNADIMKPAVEIDSHRAVRALITIEEIVKFTIPESAIKEGGYETFDEMKEDLIPRVQALFEIERKKVNA